MQQGAPPHLPGRPHCCAAPLAQQGCEGRPLQQADCPSHAAPPVPLPKRMAAQTSRRRAAQTNSWRAAVSVRPQTRYPAGHHRFRTVQHISVPGMCQT